MPRPSSFSFWTSVSYQISLPAIVDTPRLLRLMLRMAFLETRLPRAALPLMASVAKSYSKLVFLSLALGRRFTFTVSASPLWLAEKYSMRLPGVPRVMSYSLSRVTLVTGKRLA